ncbi:MAG: adenylosuccinate synthetase [Candidatus Parvarchaeota archaeon]|nr:adenylosuccinate synthetase [Candidatus Jingweiarchaeum tengchongense]MCW1304562.1 adenylosuccinate synthetase [Candidatus Jingweiarchaeum tengchongense]
MLNIVVGGFYGDEGKGKIVGYLAVKDNFDFVVRAGGGPQAGHTVIEGKKVTQIPSGFINPNSRLLIARGTIINPEVVLDEIEKYGVGDRVGIDYGCTIIEQKHIEQEKELVKRIGSVGTGTGPARADRVLRKARIAKEIYSLKPYLTDVADEVNEAIKKGKKVLIEGVQGYALSLLDHKFYPYVTSQDTTASQFAADVGIGPKTIDDVLVVYKAYASRVGIGPMNFEWDEEKRKKYGIEERGTVSGRLRRLGDFDLDLARESLIRNTGTQAAITCIDRLFNGNSGIKKFDELTEEAKKFVNRIDYFLRKSSPYFKGIKIISTGPNLEDTIDLR